MQTSLSYCLFFNAGSPGPPFPRRPWKSDPPMLDCSAWLSWEVSFPDSGGSLILFCCRCYRSSPCCRGDSITKTNTRKTLRSRFQPSRLQTRRNENNLCNLNRINPNAPKGSGCLFLGCKHHQPGCTDDRPKVQSGVEVRLLYCELDQRWGRTNQHRAGLPSQRSSPPCSGSIRAPCSQISLVKTALRREALIAQWLT